MGSHVTGCGFGRTIWPAQADAVRTQEQRTYLATTKDEGNKRKDFFDFVS